jgi:drug/metabolite transporter (DMT)-like permease
MAAAALGLEACWRPIREVNHMGLLASVLLIALGAILLLAVDGSVGGVDASTIGVICLVVGAVGSVASFVLSSRSRGAGDDDERMTSIPR